MLSALCLTTQIAIADEGKDYIGNVEIAQADINFDYNMHPVVAYLCTELKNNGSKNIANLTFEINYYDEDGYPIKKAVLKNALTEPIPQGEARKYKIRLKGDIVNIEREQYPFSMASSVDDFKVKIIDVKLARK